VDDGEEGEYPSSRFKPLRQTRALTGRFYFRMSEEDNIGGVEGSEGWVTRGKNRVWREGRNEVKQRRSEQSEVIETEEDES